MPPDRSPYARRGSAPVAAVFWLFALLLLGGPFLLPPQAPTATGLDEGRAEGDLPFEQDVANFERELELDLAAAIEAAGEEWFAFDSERLAGSGLIEVERLASGRALYALHCQGCHGVDGDGSGPAARHLAPRPRNFRKGLFKFTSTQSGGKPLRRDLLATITNGLAGASMPGFSLLAEEHRRDLVEYVRWLAMRGELETLMLDEAWNEEELPDAEELAGIVLERWDPAGQEVVYPSAAEPPADAGSVRIGRELFLDPAKANCAACHGPEGRGDGPTADAYTDDWGYPIRPRDFSAGVFRVGQEAADLYRSIATGIQGTPMGAFAGTLTPEEIWHLAHFVQSLAAKEVER